MKRTLAVLFGLLLSMVATAGQREIDAIRAKYAMPALAVLSVKGDVSEGYVSGVRKWGDPTEARAGDRFHLGSCTKAMTATLLARHIELGQLRWDSTLGELLPELSASMDPAYRGTRIELLTSHRSGLPTAMPDGLWQRLDDPKLDPTEGRKLVARAMLTVPPSHAPGKYEYSNAGYIVVGAILERITGKSWETLMREELFAPLGMKSCGFGAQADPTAAVPDQPWPHRVKNGAPVPVVPDFFGDNPPTLGPAGTVNCSLEDWAKFARAHMDGFNGKPTPVLRAESFHKLHEPYLAGGSGEGDGYTYGGWIRVEREWAGGPAFTHEGSNTMNLSTIWIGPKKGIALLGATNVRASSSAVDEALSSLF